MFQFANIAIFYYITGVLEAMEENSPDAKVFVLIHKMDLIAEEFRVREFNQRSQLIKERSQQ